MIKNNQYTSFTFKSLKVSYVVNEQNQSCFVANNYELFAFKDWRVHSRRELIDLTITGSPSITPCTPTPSNAISLILRYYFRYMQVYEQLLFNSDALKCRCRLGADFSVGGDVYIILLILFLSNNRRQKSQPECSSGTVSFSLSLGNF